ncbi:hypothetical protein CAEBREN_08625 [Caenorhabditis brenneri]|uniref:Uncharacterized protein n=1 Tax=Caenorhabditis brenneri TaxID=135651 RepID=G0NLT0_CAEBE|nr:hypothetical protein CAEBREN_08625 [Caenorhabditis brenneri]
MRLKILFFAIFLFVVNAQDFDLSFHKMCEYYKGEYKARTGGSKSMVGDVCKFKFPYATDNKTKCEFKQNWTNAEGVRRHLDAGKPEIQFFYFCNENRTENCDQWVDENNVPIESSSKEDNLVNETFTIEKMSIQILGDYVKIPHEKGDKKLIIE